MKQIPEDARDIPEHAGYRVARDGTVWSCWKRRGNGRGRAPTQFQSTEWHQLRPRTHRGIARVNLGRGRSRSVGPLVLEAFVGPRPDGHECCHFPDPDPMNCGVDNLQWGTSQENTAHQRLHASLVGGERHGMSKLSNDEVELVRSTSGTQQEIATRFGISQGHVSDIRNYKKRTATSHAGKGLHHG